MKIREKVLKKTLDANTKYFRRHKSTRILVVLFFLTLGVGTQYLSVLFFYILRVFNEGRLAFKGRKGEGERRMGGERRWETRRRGGRQWETRRGGGGDGDGNVAKPRRKMRQTAVRLRPKQQPGEQRQRARGGAEEGFWHTRDRRRGDLVRSLLSRRLCVSFKACLTIRNTLLSYLPSLFPVRL